MADIGWEAYVDKYTDLSSTWDKIKSQSTEWGDLGYWNKALGDQRTKEAFGKYHWEKEGGSKSRNLNPKSTDTDTRTNIVEQPEKPDLPTYEQPDKIVTPGPEDRPKYEGPEYVDWRTEDPTPVGITLAEVQDDEFVENRLTNLLDKNSPMFREAAEMIMRRNAGRGLGRNVSMAQEEVMSAIFKVAQPIVMADALMLERHRTLRNTSYYQQMNTRLQGAIQEALSHIAGGYQIQASIINDITNRWKAQLAADIQTYNIDVGAAAKIYGTDVAAATTIYDTDVKKWLGMEGLKVKFAEIYSNIEDNAEAAAFLWDMVFGDNDLNPSEWVTKWKEKFGDSATAAGQSSSSSSTDNEGGMTTQQQVISETISSTYEKNMTKANWQDQMRIARLNGIETWFKDKYIEPEGD